MGKRKQLSISILVVTRNRKHDLSQCLNSIVAQNKKPHEVLIVENNEKKTLHELIKLFDKELPIKYYLEKRINIAHARNTAIKRASCEILAFTDDDCVLTKNWVNKIHEIFIKDHNIVGIIGKSLNYYKKNKIAQLEQLLYKAWLSQYFNSNKSSYITSGMFINTRNFSIKSDILKKYKIEFDPNVPHKIEDTDLGLRLYNALNPKTERVLFEPHLAVLHKNSQQLVQFFRRQHLSRKGTDWLNKKFPNFEQSVPEIYPTAFSNLQDQFLSVKILFFLERQCLRLSHLSRKGRQLIKSIPTEYITEKN